jgi:maleate cis-trans isomerase
MTEKRLAGRLVVPENNMAMEPEMNALCPELAPFLVARVVRTLVREDLLAYREARWKRSNRSSGEKLDLVVNG